MLDSVFSSHNPFLIFGLMFLLIFLGAFEAVYSRSKRRFHGMVPHPLSWLNKVYDCFIQFVRPRMSCWSSWSSICSRSSADMGTYKIDPYRRHAPWQRRLWNCNWL